MIKIYLPFFILNLLLFSSKIIFSQVTISDTIFINKDSEKGIAQSIYILKNPTSEDLKSITNFSFLNHEKESYQYSLKFLKDKQLKLNKTKPIIKHTNWVILNQYLGKFYAYKPCDFVNHFKQSINDSSFIDWTGDGTNANKIISQKQIDKRTFEFNLAGIHNSERKLIVHIIDAENGIAIFEETGKESDTHFYLMIAADKIKTVPLIVNNCQTQKQQELNFDEPDFKELLKRK